ncbi:MAG: SLC13 family permease [Lachnospiraceae bacterium]|nr:SLC13 family permease [Lachnospiraceae bacterium]
MTKIAEIFKSDTVLFIAATVAMVSMFFVPPNLNYIEYIDFRVLALLFCLMAVVSGTQKAGLFNYLSKKLISITKNFRQTTLVLVLLCFFSSMLITNDVALITFVPLAISVVKEIAPKKIIFVVVMQTVAANLGSMFTPMGNPQNLFLTSFYNISIPEFLKIVAPVALLSLVLIICIVCLGKNEKTLPPETKIHISLDKNALLVYLALFAVCLLTVINILNWKITLGIVCISLFLKDKTLFKTVDYSLLFTFLSFFIFVGNIGNIEKLRTFISSLINGQELVFSVAISQIISNVPAALMLSGFTNNSTALVLGTNIGGLGTPVASLASLISLKLYSKVDNCNVKKYLMWFSVINIGIMAMLLCLVLWVM